MGGGGREVNYIKVGGGGGRGVKKETCFGIWNSEKCVPFLLN